MKAIYSLLFLFSCLLIGCTGSTQVSVTEFNKLIGESKRANTMYNTEYLGHDSKNAYIEKWEMNLINKNGKTTIFYTPISSFPKARQAEILADKNYTPKSN